MKRPVSRDRAESRAVNRFRKLWLPLTELLECLQDLEPHDTPVTDVAITRKPEGGISIAYHAHPARLVIVNNGRRYTLQIDEVGDGKKQS